MGDLPRVTIPKIQACNSAKAGTYSIYASWINREILNKKTPNNPIGILVPCGEYNSLKEAEEARAKLSLETNASSLVICKTNHHVPIGPLDSSNKIVYSRYNKSSIEEVEKSMLKSREDYQKSLNHEKEMADLAKDPTTLGYLIKVIDELRRAGKVIKHAEENLRHAKERLRKASAEIDRFSQDQPEVYESWKEDSKLGFESAERMDAYNELLLAFENRPFVKSVSSDITQEVWGDKEIPIKELKEVRSTDREGWTTLVKSKSGAISPGIKSEEIETNNGFSPLNQCQPPDQEETKEE